MLNILMDFQSVTEIFYSRSILIKIQFSLVAKISFKFVSQLFLSIRISFNELSNLRYEVDSRDTLLKGITSYVSIMHH